MQACGTSLTLRKLNNDISFAPRSAGPCEGWRDQKYNGIKAFPEENLRHKIVTIFSQARVLQIAEQAKRSDAVWEKPPCPP
jgi:hypothetical protein